MLKEALKQSGCSWDHERFMIQAEPHLWENLIVSFPKIKKFRNLKATFPLFHVLGELYDGHLAEGNYNFTSLRFPEDEALKQILLDAEDEVQVLDDTEAEEVHGEDPNVHQMEEDDVEVVKTRLDNVPREKEESAQQTRQQRRISATTKHDKKEEKESKKANKSSNVEGMMERRGIYIDVATN
ncbi:hypothetical protein QOZ80_8BG0656790 [Eleusine coracana subsp. coracana]|nr:hypothetical protein QOZ80_8BG0656790 [Eleusine coracana subsp. coracana]